MKWEVRAKKSTADDGEIDGAYARSQDALRRKDVKHANAERPNPRNTKAGKAAKRRGPAVAEVPLSSSSECSSGEGPVSSDTSSDSEDDEQDDLQVIVGAVALDADVIDERPESTSTASATEQAPPSDRVTFSWRHRRFVRGEFQNG